MESTTSTIGIVGWQRKQRERCIAYRTQRDGTVSAAEQTHLRALFQDIYWFAVTVTMSELVCYKGPVPQGVFANQTSPRRAMEVYRYLAAGYTRSRDKLHEVAELATALLARTAADRTGKTSVLEAMLTYDAEERTGEYTDVVVDEVLGVLTSWDRDGFVEAIIPDDEPLEVVPYDDGKMKFGFRIDDTGFHRIREGKPNPLSSEAFLLAQHGLAEDLVRTSLPRFSRWVEAAQHMHPAIAVRRVLIPVQLRAIDELSALGSGGIGSCSNCVDADGDYVEWTDGTTQPNGPEEIVLRGGLSPQEAEKTISGSSWSGRTIAQLQTFVDPFLGT